MVSCLVFKTLSHFEYIFVHGMRVYSSFIDICVVVQLSQHHCWRDSPFPLYFLVSFVNWPSVQFSSVTQSCPTLCDSMNHSMPGLPVHHQLPEFVFISGLFIQFHWSTWLFVPTPYCCDYCSFVIMSHNPLFGFKQFAWTTHKTQRNILLTGLHPNLKEAQCQHMFKLAYSCTHFTC